MKPVVTVINSEELLCPQEIFEAALFTGSGFECDCPVLFHQVYPRILVDLLEAYHFMHGGIDNSTQVSLIWNQGAIPVGKDGDEMITTGKLGELGEILFQECLCRMWGDIWIKVERGEHANEECAWTLLAYQ